MYKKRKTCSESRDIDKNDIAPWHGRNIQHFPLASFGMHHKVFVYDIIGNTTGNNN